MKAVIILGGYRKKNTWHMARAFQEGLEKAGHEVEFLHIKDYSILPCTGCESCYETGVCILKDEMHVFYDAIDDADILVLCSPLYFYSVASDLKKVMDRGQPYWERTKRQKSTEGMKRKIGAFVSCHGGPYEQDAFFATYKPLRMYFGSVHAEYRTNCFVSATDEYPVEQREDVLEEIRAMAFNLVQGRPEQMHR
ncbi:MAG: flavodoxin family protein [Tissierellia bacterium]|jgi:multimeric flavodoxin WrbA|nr:flavodoxin family protein [Bacillota bacterium]NLK59136.1 flavodoxin family protein [Tissierellia bacterium]